MAVQVDMLRPLRPPSILIADSRLGGISATLSAYDSLAMRGYDIVAIVGTLPEPSPASDPDLDNLETIRRYIATATPGALTPLTVALPHLVPGHPDEPQGQAALREWLQAAQGPLQQLHTHLHRWHAQRAQRLCEMPQRARDAFWWPFTQQKNMVNDDVTVIDARAGESFTVVQPESAGDSAGAGGRLVSSDLYDGCASWWTQGVSGELQAAVQRQMAYGGGRYGHVIFPEAVHEPALGLSERLLETVGKGWACKVFYSDDGSAAPPETSVVVASHRCCFSVGARVPMLLLQLGKAHRRLRVSPCAVLLPLSGHTFARSRLWLRSSVGNISNQRHQRS